jgi:hypothetical protein
MTLITPRQPENLKIHDAYLLLIPLKNEPLCAGVAHHSPAAHPEFQVPEKTGETSLNVSPAGDTIKPHYFK